MSGDPHTLAGAYALRAVEDAAERHAFEEHLSRCPECELEARGLREAAARLGAALAVEPPARLRGRVMAEIGMVRQLPPVPAADPAAGRGPLSFPVQPPPGPGPAPAGGANPLGGPGFPGAPGSLDGSGSRGGAGSVGGPGSDSPGAGPGGPAPFPGPGQGPGRGSGRRSRRRAASRAAWAPRVATGLAAAFLAAAVGLGVVAVRTGDQLDRARAGGERLAAVLAAPDARTVTRTADGVTGTLVVSRSQGRMVFVSAGLSALPEGRTYQLWRIGPSGAVPDGLTRPGADGRTPPVVLGTPGDATKVGVTVEPAGGSRRPSGDPLLVMPLPPA
ncbi:anti-sigma factor [Sphaerisporangium sp. NPDC004334]